MNYVPIRFQTCIVHCEGSGLEPAPPRGRSVQTSINFEIAPTIITSARFMTKTGLAKIPSISRACIEERQY